MRLGITPAVGDVVVNGVGGFAGLPVTIAIDQSAFQIGEQSIPLSAGMSVTVEIKTDTQRIIGYLLTPLATVVSSSMHER